MPTYEYRCANGHTFELFQRMSEDAVDACPQCGGPAERLLSAGAGLLFKGSGFYITDYRSDSYKKAAAKDSGSQPSGSGSESGSGSGSGGEGGSGTGSGSKSASGKGGGSGKGSGSGDSSSSSSSGSS
ncbi:MAG: FmdB family zinc ribbon protein [Longimicrobiales bacterium]